MARPGKGYGKTHDGRKFVGVTTPLNYFGNKNGMIYAAWKLGTEGKDYKDEWYKAANAGTLAHEMIEAYLRHQPEPDHSMHPEDVRSKAETAYLGFLKWADLVKFQPINIEQSLYDDVLGLAGTPDMSMIQGRRCIIDWKTSKDIYPENWGQIAAYKYLWEVNNPGQEIEECYILQLNKETGGFSYHHTPDLSIHWEFYQTVLKAYRLYKEQLGGK